MFLAYSFGGLQLAVRAMDELCIRRAIVIYLEIMGPDRAGDSIPAEWSGMVNVGRSEGIRAKSIVSSMRQTCGLQGYH